MMNYILTLLDRVTDDQATLEFAEKVANTNGKSVGEVIKELRSDPLVAALITLEAIPEKFLDWLVSHDAETHDLLSRQAVERGRRTQEVALEFLFDPIVFGFYALDWIETR